VAENKKIRFSPEYANWRKAVFERDNWTCQICEERGGNIQADHILPFSTHVEARFDVSNGRTLCIECHKKVTKQQIADGIVPNNIIRRWKDAPSSQCI
jgi:5-methylcytosine-specific restriction endonuclease McrA